MGVSNLVSGLKTVLTVSQERKDGINVLFTIIYMLIQIQPN